MRSSLVIWAGEKTRGCAFKEGAKRVPGPALRCAALRGAARRVWVLSKECGRMPDPLAMSAAADGAAGLRLRLRLLR